MKKIFFTKHQVFMLAFAQYIDSTNRCLLQAPNSILLEMEMEFDKGDCLTKYPTGTTTLYPNHTHVFKARLHRTFQVTSTPDPSDNDATQQEVPTTSRIRTTDRFQFLFNRPVGASAAAMGKRDILPLMCETKGNGCTESFLFDEVKYPADWKLMQSIWIPISKS